MSQPTSIQDAAEQLAQAFEGITGLAPKVTFLCRDERGRPVVVVTYRGSEMVRSMQIEAFVIEQGDSIRHRSRVKDGNTILVFHIEPKERR